MCLVRKTNINTVVPTSVISTTYVVSAGTTSSSSHTGAIAGGVAGGVVGLSLIALLFWFCVRKLRRNDSNRVVVTLPTRDPALLHLDMEEVMPYVYDQNHRAALHNHPDTAEMLVPQHSAYDTAKRSDEPAGILLAGVVPPGRQGFSRTPPFPDTLDNFRSYSRSDLDALGSMHLHEERLGEAAVEMRGLNGTNHDERLGCDRIQESARDVIQHQDGGRVPLDYIHDEPKREIPPSYDSIGPDRDPHP
jgi:hypothetical protein